MDVVGTQDGWGDLWKVLEAPPSRERWRSECTKRRRKRKVSGGLEGLGEGGHDEGGAQAG